MAKDSPDLLKPGETLGPYRVDYLIGKGGMGEVYHGTDSRLGRAVAIKISAREFSDRFEREARAISSLNHPNICTLYDVGPNYLVMEFVEGNTLSHVIKQGPMPVEHVLQYAVQIADALSAAHAKGIIHRDLKPGNIVVTRTGIKVLDFGLAKLSPTVPFGASGASAAVTQTAPATESGSIIGTLQYMSPEQAEGKEADERSDIFSFGAVLYEMLTGRRAFEGESKTAILAAILKDQPISIQQFRPAGPRALERVVRKCLEKKPGDRWQSAHDLKPTLELIDLDSPAMTSTSGSGDRVAPPSSRRWLLALIAIAVVAVGAGLWFWAPLRTPTSVQAVRFEVGPAEKMTFINQASMAVSPNGRWLVFPANGVDNQTRYYLRSLDGVEVRPLPGTEGGTASPAAWTHDSRWILISNNLGASKLRKVDVQGGPPQNIANFPGNLAGADSNANGVIIAGSGGSILRVPTSGGEMIPVTALAPGDSSHRWPQFLPDGKHFIYLRVNADPAKTGVYVGLLDAPPNQQGTERLLVTNRQAYYAPSTEGGLGHLLFMRESTLMAQTFDAEKRTLSGDPSPIADGIDAFDVTNHALFAVSDSGALVYRGGAGILNLLTWFDLQGNPAGTIGDSGAYGYPAVSPDGNRIAVEMGPRGNKDIAILDNSRGGAVAHFTFDPAVDIAPLWSPDGKNIVFSSNRSGTFDLYIKPADGSGEEKLLYKSSEAKFPDSFTKDGRFLLFESEGTTTGSDIWALPLKDGGKPFTLIQTKHNETGAVVSPDGRWLAYRSDESEGVPGLYVRPFTPDTPAGTGAKWLISNGSVTNEVWSTDSKELYYSTVTGKMMAVDIDASNGFRAGTPRPLFNGPTQALSTGWEMSPDRKRFLFIAPPSAGRVIPFTVVLNWAAALKK